jgi:hypothetical protein
MRFRDFQLARESSKQFLRSWNLHHGIQRQGRGGPSDKPDKVSKYGEQRLKTGLTQIEKWGLEKISPSGG